MVYKDFLAYVQQEVARRLGPGHTASIRQVPKNNGILLDGLCISHQGRRIAPTIYLNPYYEQYQGQQMGKDDVVDDILEAYEDNLDFPAIDIEGFLDFQNVSHQAAYKLVDTASNADFLSQVPHVPFLDLSIVFYLFIEETKQGQMTAIITNDHLAMWNLTTQDLYEAAKDNTPLLFPAEIRSMSEVLKEIARANLGQDYREDVMDGLLDSSPSQTPLYVLTNRNSINGACCMLYPGVLKSFADELGLDLVILPSSIHEVLLVPDIPDLSYPELQEMVQQINTSEVPIEDRLSNQIYLYLRETDNIVPLPCQNNRIPN